MGHPAPSAGPILGRVTAFDPGRGLGTLEAEDGTTYAFHATAITDGSRRIDVEAAVVFTVAPGHRGRYEARSVSPASNRASSA